VRTGALEEAICAEINIAFDASASAGRKGDKPEFLNRQQADRSTEPGGPHRSTLGVALHRLANEGPVSRWWNDAGAMG
jgi:hypothetical protein